MWCFIVFMVNVYLIIKDIYKLIIIIIPQEACEACGDCILDLADYCFRRISLLIARYVVIY